MALFVFFALATIGMIWIGLPVWISSVKTRVEKLERDRDRQFGGDGELARLEGRVVTLEAAIKRQTIARPAAAASPAVPAAAFAPVGQEVTVPRVVAPAPVVTPPPAVTPPPVAAPIVTAPPVIARRPPVESPSVEPVERPAPAAARAPLEPLAPSEPKVHVPASSSSDTWEVVVGTSWLNKIGVLVFVIGMALLLGYSMAHVGPAGRVAVGYVVSLGMLGAGVALERRPQYRNYAYGLIAGGWAAVYFTTYAMHGVEAARVIDNPFVAATALAVVAAAMVAHSVRYRSQTVTALAYTVAYATLALTPLSEFSLAASVPLAMSVLFVAQRFGWPGVSVLGVVSTYGLFVLRGRIFPDSVMDGTSALPYIVLGVYWITFEAADVLALRTRADTSSKPAPLFALNAAGLVGAALVELPADDPHALFVFLASAGAAYIASAIARARLLGEVDDGATTDQRPFGTFQGSVAIAAALIGWAIETRFFGTQVTLGLLAEAEMLFAAGLALGDRHIRLTGSVLSVVVTLHAVPAYLVGARQFSDLAVYAASIVAAAWYINREWLRARNIDPNAIERGYTWAGSALVLSVLVHEPAPAFQGLAMLVFGVALIEAGLRRAAEYRPQGYIASLLGATAIIGLFGAARVTTIQDCWVVLTAATVLAYGLTVRLMQHTGDARVVNEARGAAAGALCLGTILLVMFEWRVLPINAIAPAWAASALGLLAVGAWPRTTAVRWQAYPVLLLAAIRQFQPLANRSPIGSTETAAILTVIAALYGSNWLARRALRTATITKESAAELELAVPALTGLAATIGVVLLEWRGVDWTLVGAAWAVSAIALLGIGTWRRLADLRWQAYALLLMAAWRATTLMLDVAPSTTLAIASAVTVIAALYGGSLMSRAAASRSAEVTEGPAELERMVPILLRIAATGSTAVLQWRTLEPLVVGPGWTTAAALLLAIGVWRRMEDLRWQAYPLMMLGAIRTLRPILSPEPATTETIVWMSVVIGVLYLASLLCRRVIREANQPANPEEFCRLGLSVFAGVLLTTLIGYQLRPTLVTLAWGLAGASLLAVGFPARERVMRLSGLALLFLCILRVFVFDLSRLEALARILSFVVLGLVLLAVSWVYTRYSEQIRKYL